MTAKDSTARDATAQRLGAGQNVRLDVVHLHGKELTAAAHTGLHFIGYQNDTMSSCCRAQRLEKFARQIVCARHALYGLKNHSGDFVTDHLRGCGGVVSRNEFNCERMRRKAIPFFGIPGHRSGSGCPAMKSVCNAQDFVTAGCHTGHAQRVFVGLGARIHEEHSVDALRSNANQFFRGFCAHFQRNRIALKQQPVTLLVERMYEAWVAIAQCCNGMRAIQI